MKTTVKIFMAFLIHISLQPNIVHLLYFKLQSFDVIFSLGCQVMQYIRDWTLDLQFVFEFCKVNSC